MALTGHRAWARTSAGSIIAGAAVEVRRVADNSLATLYTDAGGGTGVSNPFTTEADGSYEFYTEPDRYNVLVGTGASQETVPLDLTDGRAQVPWPSRAQAVTDIAGGFEAADGTIKSDGTVFYIAKAGETAISDMPGWIPFGAAYPQHFGEAVGGVWDDTLLAWIAYLDSAKVDSWVPEGVYPVLYVRNRLLQNSIAINAHPNARFVGEPTKATVFGNDVITSYTVTEFTVGNDGFVVVYITGGVESVWTDGVEYTATGQTVDFAVGSAPHGVLATGDSLRIVSADPIFELGQDSATPRNSFKWVGGIIDNSQRGFAPDNASGSGLTLNDFDLYDVNGVIFDGGDDYETNTANGVTDSGFTIVDCNSGQLWGCKFIGQADLGVYLSGGASSGGTDDTKGHEVHGNWFYRCQSGGKVERQVTTVSVHSNIFEECRGGWLVGGVAGGVGGGLSGHIHGNTFLRIGVRCVDLRRSNNINVHDNIIIDFGYEIDGITAQPGAWAIDVAGCDTVIIHDNNIKMVNLPLANQTGVRVRNETSGSTLESDNIRVTGNKIDGLLSGIDEDDAGTGNVFRENEITNTTTEMDVTASRRWHYRKSNVEFEGIGTTLFSGYWTPELRFGATATGTANTSVGYFERTGNVVTATYELNVALGGSVPTGSLRIYGLPFRAINDIDIKGTGVCSRVIDIAYPSDFISPETVSLAQYVQFFSSGKSGSPATVSNAHVTPSTTIQLHGQIIYHVEPEAQN